MTRVFRGLDAVTRPPRRAVVTVGVFDGVHTAHQRLIRQAVAMAKRLRGTSVVVTFDPDPSAILDPRRAPPALMPLEERLVHLRALGPDQVWVLPFSRTFSRITAGQFIRRFLLERLQAKALLVGERFVFGRHRRGDTRMLRSVGPARGMRIVPVRQILRHGAAISSSRIRRLIAEGHLSAARELLGRPPAVYGTVVRGAGRGRSLGFPTANLRLVPQALPPAGVYAVTVSTADHRRRWAGAMNLGMRPTFGPGPLVCEVHLLGFSGTLLGRRVAVALRGRLRAERCFPSVDALRRQVRRDILRTRRLCFTRSS